MIVIPLVLLKLVMYWVKINPFDWLIDWSGLFSATWKWGGRTSDFTTSGGGGQEPEIQSKCKQILPKISKSGGAVAPLPPWWEMPWKKFLLVTKIKFTLDFANSCSSVKLLLLSKTFIKSRVACSCKSLKNLYGSYHIGSYGPFAKHIFITE